MRLLYQFVKDLSIVNCVQIVNYSKAFSGVLNKNPSVTPPHSSNAIFMHIFLHIFTRSEYLRASISPQKVLPDGQKFPNPFANSDKMWYNRGRRVSFIIYY